MTELSKKQMSILIKCCILVGCSIGLISNCIGIFYTPIAESLGTGRGQVAVISTIISLSSAFAGQGVARLIKKKPINIVMCIGVIMTSVGILLLSYVRKLPYFYILAAVIGIGDICFKNLTVSIVLRSWFGGRSASKLGIAMAFTGIAAAVMNPILGRIISSAGYQTAFRLLAVMIAALSLPAAYTTHLNENEEDAPVKGKDGQTVRKGRTQIPVFVMAMLCMMPLCIAGATGMNTHFSSYAVTLGYSLSFGATVVSFQSIFNSVWKIVYGILADRVGAVKSCLIYLGITIAACLMLMTLTKIPAGIIAAVCLYPAAFSVSTVGMPTIVQNVAKERYGEVFATVNMLQTIGYATFTSLYGVISDRAGAYLPCLMIVIVCAVLCGFTCIFSEKGRAEKKN